MEPIRIERGPPHILREVLPWLCDEERWRLTRDLSLLALSSYSRPESPGDNETPAVRGCDASLISNRTSLFRSITCKRTDTMSLHVYGAIVTHHGTAANNRAETDGNITTLQKLLWHGRVHSSVSAEAIRFALRRRLAEHEPTNRRWDDDMRTNTWEDHTFSSWAAKDREPFVDDDLLGFMGAEAAKEENGVEVDDNGGVEVKGKKARPQKGTAKVRRAVLEVTRAISLIPYGGDVTFNAASPGATPSAKKRGRILFPMVPRFMPRVTSTVSP